MSASDLTEWLRYAVADLAAAKLLLESGPMPGLAAYHAQQAAEKAIKAVLVSENARVPYIHDLLALARLAPPIAGMPSDADLNGLSQHAVDSRYPDDILDMDEEEAREAVEIAGTVLATVRAVLRA